MGVQTAWSKWSTAASFSMLTITADVHPLMKRRHKPDDEKRMVVILEPKQYDEWLHCPVDEVADFFTQYPAERPTARPSPKGTKPVVSDAPMKSLQRSRGTCGAELGRQRQTNG
jgi:putative SOS response-associated peptidase YedK